MQILTPNKVTAAGGLRPGVDRLLVDSGEGWSACVERVDADTRDEHGKGRYLLELISPTGTVEYSTRELYLQDWHDVVAHAAGWASAILDPESGYPDMSDGDELERIRQLPRTAHASGGFAGIECERVGA